jgi:hypothetical protein
MYASGTITSYFCAQASMAYPCPKGYLQDLGGLQLQRKVSPQQLVP